MPNEGPGFFQYHKIHGDRPPHGTSVYLRHKPDWRKKATLQLINIPQFKFMDICTMGHKMGEMCKNISLQKKNTFMLSFFP